MKPLPPISFWAKTLIAEASVSLALLSSGGTSLAADASSSPAEPIDLTTAYTKPISVVTNNWKTAVVGHQVFHGVPFQIDGVIYLWGTGPSAGNSSPWPEFVPGIAVNRKFQALYVCHSSYYKSPDDTPVFQVVFRYGDSSSLTNTLCFGDDILDWKVSPKEAPLRTPSGTNSMLAWIGGEFSAKEKTPLRNKHDRAAESAPGPDSGNH